MDSRGIAVRFHTEPMDFPTIVSAQTGYRKQTKVFSTILLAFLLAYKVAGAFRGRRNFFFRGCFSVIRICVKLHILPQGEAIYNFQKTDMQ
jgi:hypothetical protein